MVHFNVKCLYDYCGVYYTLRMLDVQSVINNNNADDDDDDDL